MFKVLPLAMREVEPPFSIPYGMISVTITEREVKGKRVFHIEMGEERKPLVITVAERPGGERFWTSIPQGRQLEAEEIGRLNAAYIRSKR